MVSGQVADFGVALDSGCVDHVCGDSDAPGFSVAASEGSSRGQAFVVGNGERSPHRGQLTLTLEAESDNKVSNNDSIVQVSKVTRPLMRVSRICDSGFTCHVGRGRAVVKHGAGKIVCVLERRGGLYVCRLTLRTHVQRRGH